jgi:Xaa-Pro aminopeptidase
METEKLLAKVGPVMRSAGLDGWLLYDFRGTNPFARRVLGLEAEGLLTRRWFAWLPASGEPRLLVHGIEAENISILWPTLTYESRESLERGLGQLLDGARKVAMEFSPKGNNPYLSRVDAGTVDLIRSLGVEVVSSGDLLQTFLIWSEAQAEGHRQAAQALARAKDAALGFIRTHLERGSDVLEHEVQEHLVIALGEEGLIFSHPPIVAFGGNAAKPHHRPSSQRPKALKRGEVVLLDLWGKLPGPMPYADLTWIACWGAPELEVTNAFAAVVEARDCAVAFMDEALRTGKEVRGWEVDQVAREVLNAKGYGLFVKHRTGHSLGIEEVHGEAVHLDGFESLDERKLIPGLGLTVEPGVYPGAFGLRSEIDILTHPFGVEVTTPLQNAIELL